MSKAMNEKLGTCDFENLINADFPACDVFGVTVAAGHGDLKRGTVLALSSSTSKMVILGTEAGQGETLSANCILAEDVATGADTTAAGITAQAYRTGHFNRNKVIVADEYTMTLTDEENLRKGGILLDTAI